MEFGVQPPHASLLFVDVRFQIIPPPDFPLPGKSPRSGLARKDAQRHRGRCSLLRPPCPQNRNPRNPKENTSPCLDPAGLLDSRHGVWAGGAADQPGGRRAQDQQRYGRIRAGRSRGPGGHSSRPGSSRRASGEDSGSSLPPSLPVSRCLASPLPSVRAHLLSMFLCTAVNSRAKDAGRISGAEQSLTADA